MRLRSFSIALLFSLSLLRTTPAMADGFVSPFIGNNLGGDAGHCASVTDCTSKHLTYGVVFGSMIGGVLGIEEDFSYAPDFFGRVPSFGNNSLLSAMTNLIVGIPLGPIRPYASGGGGLVRTTVHSSPGSADDGSNTSLGYSLGGGVMGFIVPRVGIRADYRYIRTAKDFTLGDFSINNKKLNFSRATAGVVFQF